MDDKQLIGWLLDGDPSVAWQAQRDLVGADESDWFATRSLVDSQGWGAGLLAAQDPEGTWGGGLYTPKWTSTNYTLLQLRRMGLDPANPQAIRGAHILLDRADWHEGGVSYWKTHRFAERCVNGMVLSIAAWFDTGDERIDSIAELLVGATMADGGWNCNDYRGDTHSSFHTTISVLEGLTVWKRRTGRSDADAVIAGAHEFLLQHRLYKSHRTGEVASPAFTRFAFPPRWHYDVLRGLDHLQDVDAGRDERAADAIELLLDKRRSDGGWGVGPRYTGVVHFRMEEGRQPSRWNTLRALRVLKWWNRS